MDLVSIDGNPIPEGARSGAIRTRDGLTLRYAAWPAPAGKRQGTVCLFQGRNEWIEKYFETIGELNRRGFAVATFDWRGQGGSERMVRTGLCHVEDYADYDRDFDAFMRELVLPDCPPPYFALAHSMGALACLRAVRDKRVRFERMVLLTPMLALSRVVSPPMGLVRTFSALQLFLGRDQQPISRRPWARWRRLQPEREPRQLRASAILEKAPALRTGVPTVRWIYASALAMKEARTPEFGKAVGTPSLIVTAGSDIVVANEPIAALAEAMRTGHRVIIPGARHEILMDTDPIREMFWAAFDAFIPGTPDDADAPSAAKNAEYAVV